MQIDVLLFEGFDELDVFGPFEVLSSAGEPSQFEVRLVTGAPCSSVTGAHGARVQPHGTLAPRPDLLLVPGGGWIDGSAVGARAEAQRGDLPAAIASRHGAGSTVAAVCTGTMLAAAAGLVAGRPAVTHHGAIEDLRAAGAQVIEGARVVDDGDLISAGGVTSGIDLALWIVERELGSGAADATAGHIEYQRRGPLWPRDF